MARGNLSSRRKFRKQGVNRSDMECWNKFFQFGEEDGDKSGYRLLEPSTFLNLIKTVTGK